MARKQKMIDVTSTAGSMISDAFAEIEELRGELESWYDNLPENFQSGEKGEMLQAAIDELGNSSEPVYLDCVNDLTATYQCISKPRLSRSARRDNCCAMLAAAVSAIEAEAERLRDLTYNDDGVLMLDGVATPRPEKSEDEIAGVYYDETDRDGAVSELECSVDELETAQSEWESVEFPGMFG